MTRPTEAATPGDYLVLCAGGRDTCQGPTGRSWFGLSGLNAHLRQQLAREGELIDEAAATSGTDELR